MRISHFMMHQVLKEILTVSVHRVSFCCIVLNEFCARTSQGLL